MVVDRECCLKRRVTGRPCAGLPPGDAPSDAEEAAQRAALQHLAGEEVVREPAAPLQEEGAGVR